MTALEQFRKLKDDHFRQDAGSPLSPELKKTFTGLNYFPENDALNLTLDLERYEAPEHVEMQTSKGDVRDYIRVGQIRFSVDQDQVSLQVYESEDDPGSYFVPFIDATAPRETYGAGRYLEPERVGHDRLLVDFNLAYNPYCVYDYARWSCPIPPTENRLSVRIEAGEKNFEPHYSE